MKHAIIKKVLLCAVFTVMTCMLITVDREASLINNREPILELRVTRVDKEDFAITFLGHQWNLSFKKF